MSAPGAPVPYWVLANIDGFYYTGYKQNWTSKLHYAAMLSEELAEKLQKRYHGSTIEREMAYEVNPKETLASCGEPEAKTLLAEVIKLCKRENWSLETTQVQVEQFYNAAKAA